MIVTFYNVTIGIEAETAKLAYQKLCGLMAGADVWASDVYNHDEDEETERSTLELAM